jgi:septum site-determining protein MinD
MDDIISLVSSKKVMDDKALDTNKKVIGIVSLKGGVGKTSSVANLGVAMSEFGKKVLIVDANFSTPNLGLHLGLLNPEVTIHDVLLDKAKAHEAVYAHESGIHLIPGTYLSEKINPLKLKEKIDCLRDHYDIILVDSSPNLNDEISAAMEASDELYVVTTPDYITLSTTLRAVMLAKQRGISISGLILNKVRNKKFELSLNDIEETVGVPVVGVLPEDENVLKALANTTPVTLHSPNTKISIGYKKLAASLIGKSYEDFGRLGRLRSFFRINPRFIRQKSGIDSKK